MNRAHQLERHIQYAAVACVAQLELAATCIASGDLQSHREAQQNASQWSACAFRQAHTLSELNPLNRAHRSAA